MSTMSNRAGKRIQDARPVFDNDGGVIGDLYDILNSKSEVIISRTSNGYAVMYYSTEGRFHGTPILMQECESGHDLRKLLEETAKKVTGRRE